MINQIDHIDVEWQIWLSVGDLKSIRASIEISDYLLVKIKLKPKISIGL